MELVERLLVEMSNSVDKNEKDGFTDCSCHCHHKKVGKTCLKFSPETSGMRNVCPIDICSHCKK